MFLWAYTFSPSLIVSASPTIFKILHGEGPLSFAPSYPKMSQVLILAFPQPSSTENRGSSHWYIWRMKVAIIGVYIWYHWQYLYIKSNSGTQWSFSCFLAILWKVMPFLFYIFESTFNSTLENLRHSRIWVRFWNLTVSGICFEIHNYIIVIILKGFFLSSGFIVPTCSRL